MKKVALITGGTRGIGLGIAKALGAEGYILALNGVRPTGEVADVIATLQEEGNAVSYHPADISQPNDRANLLISVKDRWGQLNLLVNNAGVAPAERLDMLEATEGSYDIVMDTNLKGPHFINQAVARWMVEQQATQAEFDAKIIFITSISATVGSANRGEYCLSKAALSMSARLWAIRLSEYDIPVYEIRPGVIATDMTTAVKKRYDNLLGDGLALQKRWGTPEDVGRAAAALARGDLPYSTGETILVDGGLTVPRL